MGVRHLGCDPSNEPPWEELDDGIRETVRLLWSNGFSTSDSGDGRLQGWKADMEGTIDVPHVFSICAPDELIAECNRLKELCDAHILGWSDADGVAIQGSYSPMDGLGIVELYGVHDGMVWR